ncbi:DUF2794 domain-containing protein [Pedomonas sp. V897]|uniref:DUF2794 domain-containing protein n=1 Tax=Pedomonas sp. V897 TaxID=3446482 RepID=UPI003EE25AC2
MENITPIRPFPPSPRSDGGAPAQQVVFDRLELGKLLGIYGRGVAMGVWRDYAIDMHRDQAIFSIFQRSSDRPEFRLVKQPDLARKQGQYALVGQSGAILKRGAELTNVLRLLERKLLKVVDA